MKINPTPELTKLFWKEMCNAYNADPIYTGSLTGKINKYFKARPIIKKACKKAGIRNPSKWLENRYITVGNLILYPNAIGVGTSPKALWRQIIACCHEITHIVQQCEESPQDFYNKYIRSTSYRAVYELEAIKTELYVNTWNKIPVPEIDKILNSFKDIYGFNKDTLYAIEISLNSILNAYYKRGPTAFTTTAGRTAIHILEQLN